MSSQNEHSENGVTGSTAPAGTGKSNAALSSRFQQMFPVLSANQIDRIRRFGEVERFPDGKFLFQAGEAVAGRS
jgi:thioredoxin reductase (NADPH)